MNRNILGSNQIELSALSQINGFHAHIVQDVKNAISQNKIVVVGMRQNPVVKSLKKALHEAGITFTYLEYGSYFSQWKQRLAIKLWSGWPTYPQVFVNGKLIGGKDDALKALKEGKIS